MATSPMQVDHVVVATDDLDAAARELEARYRLTAVEGGRHVDWGTANRIVPLGDTYLELVSVVDSAKARESAFGRWVALGSTGLLSPLGWAVRTDDIDGVAARNDLVVETGSRLTPSGEPLRWRFAGVDRAVAEPCLPFFIEWEEGSTFPGSGGRPTEAVRLSMLVLGGDPERVAEWLGGHALPIEVRPGPPAVAAVVLRIRSGNATVTLR
jgi:hypothetical protein